MFRPRTSRPLILLVDDDPFQAEVASYIAEELDCDFESALSGTEALEKVAQRAPDVVLLDVRMDDLSGTKSAAGSRRSRRRPTRRCCS
ncbi:MAG: response regulator [Holophagales bacterium]|nr:response regulator [Holophagales bacterium]